MSMEAMEASLSLAGEPQLPTAPELPTSSSGASGESDNRVDTDNIGWNKEHIASNGEDSSTQLRHRGAGGVGGSSTATAAEASSSTAYSFTGSALADLNEPTSSTSTAAGGAENKDRTEHNNNEDSLYECNICLDTAKDAVVSMCGHLFCWPCLHQWLQTRPNRKLCPVCKAAVDKDKVIPLYGRNSTRQEDPRNKVPPRPAGHRTEPEPAPGFPGFGFGDGFHMSFGIGAFPFGFFTSSLNFGEPRPAAANRGTTQYEDEQTLSKLFLYLAFLCIAWLLFA